MVLNNCAKAFLCTKYILDSYFVWCIQKILIIKKERYFFVLFLFLLQDNSYSFLVLKFQVSKLKIAIEVISINLAAKVLIFKRFNFKTD